MSSPQPQCRSKTGKSRSVRVAERPDGIGVLFMVYATLAKFVINQRSNYEKGWTMITRRQFLKASGLAGAGSYRYPGRGRPLPCQYQVALLIDLHPEIWKAAGYRLPCRKPAREAEVDDDEIAVRQFQQQILPTAMPVTTVWSYGSVNHAGYV